MGQLKMSAYSLRDLSASLRVVSCLLGCLWLGQSSGIVQAQPREATEALIYDFGLHLFRDRDYYRAITEFKRFSLLFPRHPRRPAAELLIGLALQEDTAYDDAWTHFQRWRLTDDPTDATRVAAFKPGEIRFFQGQYRQAVEHLEGFLGAYPDGPLVAHSTYLLGLSWALVGQYARARDVLAAVPGHDPLASQALALQEELQRAPQQRQKSPRLAGLLSGILPGAGHLYAGKPWQALTALALNGVFLGGAAYAFHEKLEVTGAILLFFETGWYLGGIKSAMDAAQEANRQPPRAFAERLRERYAPPVLTFEALQAPGLGLRLSF